jgi:hypothetical protein
MTIDENKFKQHNPTKISAIDLKPPKSNFQNATYIEPKLVSTIILSTNSENKNIEDEQKIEKFSKNQINNSIKSKYQKFFNRNNLSKILTIIVYILIQLFFVLLKLLIFYPEVNPYLKVARAAGILISFNSCLIILLVLRRAITWIRNTKIGHYYPVLDEFREFHKFIGMWLVVLALIHTIGHALNLCIK